MITIEPNKTCYVFDVDGTLTFPRQKMSSPFASEFIYWAENKQCFIATGSDYSKTKEQVPWDVLGCFKYAFCCMGNETRGSKGEIIEKNTFSLPESLEIQLAEFLKNTKYAIKTGIHLEYRTGMVNFSIVGRKADATERVAYNRWDSINGEREKIVNFINKNYPTLNASIGGEISIDIIQEGYDKGQIVHALENAEAKKIVFVGDKCFPGGNDWGIIRELKKTSIAFEWYRVNGPNETLALLRTNKVFDGGK